MERQIAIWLLLGCWASISVSACESEPDIPEAELRARIASAICDKIGPCCEADGFPWDAASCRQSLELSDVLETFVPSGVAKLKVAYDSSQAERCVATFEAISTACDDTGHDIQDACGGIFRGTLKEGAFCTAGIECIARPGRIVACQRDIIGDNAHCETDVWPARQRGVLDDDCAATCTTTPDNPEGGDCDDSGSPESTAVCWTGDGLYCDRTLQRCTPLRELGEPCQFLGCVAGASCESDVCAPQRSSGPCVVNASCSSDAYCDLVESNCMPKKANGETCEFGSYECSGGRCSRNHVCENDTVASATLCAGN